MSFSYGGIFVRLRPVLLNLSVLILGSAVGIAAQGSRAGTAPQSGGKAALTGTIGDQRERAWLAPS